MTADQAWIDALSVRVRNHAGIKGNSPESLAMLGRLRRALELYTEDRLGDVLPLKVGAQNTNLQTALSTQVDMLPFSPHAMKQLAGCRVKYVAEIYRLEEIYQDNWFHSEVCKEILRVLSDALGLVEKPDLARWHAPYWDEPEFMKALSQPMMTFARFDPYPWGISLSHVHGNETRALDDFRKACLLRTNIRRLHESGPYAGNLLGSFKDIAPVHKWSEWNGAFNNDPHLRAVAFLPPGWAAPEEVPKAWQDELARIESEAQELWREWDRLHRVFMAPDSKFPDSYRICIRKSKLSARPANCLLNSDVEFMWQLVQMTEEELLKKKNFGRISLQEVKAFVESYGLSLGMKLDI